MLWRKLQVQAASTPSSWAMDALVSDKDMGRTLWHLLCKEGKQVIFRKGKNPSALEETVGLSIKNQLLCYWNE